MREKSMLGLSAEQQAAYREEGYVVWRGFFEPGEVDAVRAEITRVVEAEDAPEELVQLEPAVQRGEYKPALRELGVRKLFRMAVHDDFFRQLAFHPRFVQTAVQLLGPDVKLAQSMALIKPPLIGTAKTWHQDNAYFTLEPGDVVGFWVALDDANPENGCMHVIPRTHRDGLVPHVHTTDYGLPDEAIDPALVVPLPMAAGDALVFHGHLYHYTPPNRSAQRRRALQLHYVSARCKHGSNPPRIRTELLVAGREYPDCI